MKESDRKSLKVNELEITSTKTIQPTPDILDALKVDYPIEASIADLVDNSIDADAKKVLIRIFREKNRLIRLCVVDNGHGMDDEEIDHAMQFAYKHDYNHETLGMFGIGMKTASLTQADTVSVLSRRKGKGYAGRQWTEAGIKKRNWQCAVLGPDSVKAHLTRSWGSLGTLSVGTVIQWDNVKDFQRLHGNPDAYLEEIKRRIRNHLGLKLHRFLQRRAVSIQMDVEDIASGSTFPPSRVEALNPFPVKTAVKGYPKNFYMSAPKKLERLVLRAHIWPKKSKDEGYKLGGGKVAEHQGFFFYRHNRLIQDGGWNGWIGTMDPHMSLARVEVDIPDSYAGYLQVRPNKTAVDAPASFTVYLAKARAKDGTIFKQYTETAEDVYRAKGKKKLPPILKPGSGVPAPVCKVILQAEIPLRRGNGITLRWDKMRGNRFFEVDRDNKALILNKKYRDALLDGDAAGAADIPVIRTLLYFLLNDTFRLVNETQLEKKKLDVINEALVKAINLEANR